MEEGKRVCRSGLIIVEYMPKVLIRYKEKRKRKKKSECKQRESVFIRTKAAGAPAAKVSLVPMR